MTDMSNGTTTSQKKEKDICTAELTTSADQNAGNSPTRKQFNAVTLLSMAFVICNSWAGVASSLQLALLQGGAVTLVYSIIVGTTAYYAIAASLAELASVYPTAGGQYHFASILAPPRSRRWLSYTCGLVAMFSWVAIGATVTFIIAEQLIAGVAAIYEGYVPQRWHVFLIYEALALLVFFYNVLALKRAPWAHNIGFFITLSTFLIYFVSTLVRAHPKQSSSFVWVTYINQTGWPNGVCFLIGLSTSCFMYIGLDAALHLAEECTEPEKTVPRTILGAISIGFVTGFSYTVAVLYGLTDIKEIMTTSGWVPYLVAVQTLRSTKFAIAISFITVALGVFVIIAVQETSSRLAWSFARDDGMLLSRHMRTMHPKLEVPVYALIFTWSLVFVCGLIYIASQTAFNALVSSTVVLQQLSFVIPIALLLIQKRSSKFLPAKRPFKMPEIVGWLVNIYAVAFTVTTLIFFNFPVFIPTNATLMNYTCVILGIAFLLGSLNWWLHARRHYNGPVVEIAGQTMYE